MNRQKRDDVTSLASKQLGVVSLVQLVQLDVSDGERRGLLDRGELVAVTKQPDVYRATSAPTSSQQAVMAAVLACGADAVASHATAAALHGVAGYRLDEKFAIHVTVPHDRHPRAAKATIHYSRALPPNHLAPEKPRSQLLLPADAIPKTSVARTLFDLGRLFDKPRVERAVDSALGADLVTVTALDRILRDLAGPGRAGTKIMRELLEERGAGFVAPRSRLERRFWEICRDYDLPTPRREVDLGTNDAWNGRVEFVFDPGVLVEIDGRRWHTALLDQLADEDRDDAFRAAGFIVLRFRYRVLRDDPARVATRVREAIESAKRGPAA
jgi:very-short-patch-repair endonuclease